MLDTIAVKLNFIVVKLKSIGVKKPSIDSVVAELDECILGMGMFGFPVTNLNHEYYSKRVKEGVRKNEHNIWMNNVDDFVVE